MSRFPHHLGLRTPQVRAALVSVSVSVGILGLKAAAYLLTGSVAFLSDAAESVVNVVAANIALVALAVATRPPDAGHPYGHGKAEYISGATEGALVAVAGGWVVFTALRRLLRPVPLQALDWGLGLVALATLANYLTARFLLRISREVRSLALEADARHLLADVLTSLAALGGVGLVRLTGLEWLDPVVGGAVGLHIVRMGAGVYREALGGLMDQSLPPPEEARIRAILDAHRDEIVDYHALRTRRVGPQRFVDLHLVLHRTLPVGEAHTLCDRLEEDIRGELPDADITIHVEPCGPACPRCPPIRAGAGPAPGRDDSGILESRERA
ncbi:MAG: cation diffusion facilitator family transporter [Armatimonadetes bacterium]|nr:cation diffusion facilitator family transporter [Armatimonadota bacterium]MDW8154107.1 cation diffusion facilitator family transporter [Armatimonadota bacterium]